MRRSLGLALLLSALCCTAAAPAPAGAAADSPSRVIAIRLASEINPVSAAFVKDSIARATAEHAAALVILLDTPGGLSTSMDDIVQAELGARVPVIVYVSPEGARAASAGVFVTMAADIAAMAPTTNIGSATPVDSSGQNIGSDLRRKVLNDAEKTIRALAQNHGRNARMAQLTVRKAADYTAAEALHGGLVDRVAPDLQTLLRELDGTRTSYKQLVLHTAGAQVESFGMPWTLDVLNVLIDPHLLYILFLAGIAGIAYEVFHPGLILPGTLGAVCLLLALFGFSLVPINVAGVALMVLGAGLLLAAGSVARHGLIALSGIVALAAGELLLFRTPGSQTGVSPLLVIAITLAFGALLALVVTRVVAARRAPPSPHGAGSGGLIGQTAVVRTSLKPRGQVFVHGELWEAEVEGATVEPGRAVVVEGVRGLTLQVSPLAGVPESQGAVP